MQMQAHVLQVYPKYGDFLTGELAGPEFKILETG